MPAGGNVFGPAKALALVIGTLLVLLGFALDPARLREVSALLPRSWLGKALTLLFAAVALSTVTASSMRTAVIGDYPAYLGFVTYAALGVVVLGAASLSMRRHFFELLCRASCVALCMMTLLAIAEQFGHFPAQLKAEGAVRVISSVGNASSLGVVVVLMLPLATHTVFAQRAHWQGLAFAALAGGVSTLVWSQSRGGWLGIIAVVATGLALAIRHFGDSPSSLKVSKRSRSLAVVVTLAAVVVAVAVTPQVLTRARGLLDLGAPTATWRFSTWESAIRMVQASPVAGVGPSGFRLGYLPFKEPGQDDGRLGYVPTEAAHNLILDTGVSFGLPGLAALLGIVVAVLAIGIRRLEDGSGPLVPIAATSALVGGVVALQLHYVTLDSGPMLAALVGVVLGGDLTRLHVTNLSRPDVTGGAVWRAGVILGILGVAVWAAASGLLLWVDAAGGRALTRVEAGSAWEPERERLSGHSNWASWEPATQRTAARAAGVAMWHEPHSRALADGVSWYEESLKRMPEDPYIAVEYARFLMNAAVRTRDVTLLDRAELLCENAARWDPSSGLPLASLGRIALMRGEAYAAIPLLENALRLSPLHTDSQSDLARAYDIAREQEGHLAVPPPESVQ
jgi:putative inorganic carbon (hco3(-)) transporter